MSDNNTPSAPQEPRGAILPAVEPARGFSDADLLRRCTAALNRTSAENERLRATAALWENSFKGKSAEWVREKARAEAAEAENDRLRAAQSMWGDAMKSLNEWRERAEAAEAKLRDVEALLPDEWHEAGGVLVRPSAIRDVLARSQAPAEPFPCLLPQVDDEDE